MEESAVVTRALEAMDSSGTGTDDDAVGTGVEVETMLLDDGAIGLMSLLSNGAPMERVDSATKTEVVKDDVSALVCCCAATNGTCP